MIRYTSDYIPTILIVDDTPANLSLLFDALEQAEYRVLVAENGVNAVDNAVQSKPDLILLDVMMPEIDGFDVCRQLKSWPETADIPVIFLSALGDIVDKLRGFEVGGVDYITKPIDVSEVFARVNTHLTVRQLQQQLQNQNEWLETRVRQRTAELEAEIIRRQQSEEERKKLLDVVRNQSDQLRQLTEWLIAQQQQQHLSIADYIDIQFRQGLLYAMAQIDLLEILIDERQVNTAKEDVATQLTKLRSALQQLEFGVSKALSDLAQPTQEVQSALDNPLLKLSAREREVLELIVTGKSNPEIAQLLYLTENTVRTYRSRMMQKLQIDDLASLIKFALKHNLTTLQA